MKCHIKAIPLFLLLFTLACAGHGTTVDIINNSQDWLSIYRLGDPNTVVTVQKRWDQSTTLPLVAGASDAMQMIEIVRQGSGITTPESSFSGFDGNFAQECTLTVQPTSISISYASESPAASSATNQTSQATNNNSAAGNGIASGNGIGGGVYGGMGYGNTGYRNPNTGDNRNTNNSSPVQPPPKPPPKKNIMAGAAGVRVKVTAPDTGKMPPLETPSALNVKTGKPNLEPIPTLSALPPEPLKRKQTGYYVVLAAIIAAIVVFIVAKIRDSHESSRPGSRPNNMRM